MKQIMKVSLIGCSLALAAGLSSLWWPDRSTESPGAAETAPARLQWRVGQSQQYDFELDSAMQMSADQSIRIRMNGGLELRTLDVSPEAAWVGFRLPEVKLEIGGQSNAATNRALGAPFRVKFASGGMPEAFEFPPEVTAENREILEGHDGAE